MALYAIGDIQGCYDEFQSLLEKLAFNPAEDQLWLTGDLVNRGPKSLETLRAIRALGDAAVAVLGNHDLHMLAVAHGISRTKHRDTFSDVLKAPDRDELLDWLRCLPLLHHQHGFYLIHAGLPPAWSGKAAASYAQEAEAVLQGPDYAEFFWHMYGNEPNQWTESLKGWDRLRYITNCLTRLRYVAPDGRADFTQKGPPDRQPKGLLPWFQLPNRLSAGDRIIFGHWSTLGFYAGDNVYCLDTGCLWGGELTALRLDGPPQRTSVGNVSGGYHVPLSPPSS